MIFLYKLNGNMLSYQKNGSYPLKKLSAMLQKIGVSYFAFIWNHLEFASLASMVIFIMSCIIHVHLISKYELQQVKVILLVSHLSNMQHFLC